MDKSTERCKSGTGSDEQKGISFRGGSEAGSRRRGSDCDLYGINFSKFGQIRSCNANIAAFQPTREISRGIDWNCQMLGGPDIMDFPLAGYLKSKLTFNFTFCMFNVSHDLKKARLCFVML